jgi:hypothetical protein
VEEHAQAHEDSPELRLDVQHPSWSRHLVLVDRLVSLLFWLGFEVSNRFGVGDLLLLVL